MAFAKLHHRQNSKGDRIYYVEYRLPGRKNSKFTIGNVQARKAKEIADNVRALIVQGIDPHEYVREQSKYSKEKPRLKLSELENAYNEYCSKRNRPNTIEIKQIAFKKLYTFLGNCYVDTISPESIESWISNLKLSKTTININLRAVRAMFNWGFKRKMFNTNPFSEGRIKQYKVVDSDPDQYFSLEEVEIILKTIKEKNERMWRLVLLALETGGRVSELIALTGNDIDLENARVLFRGPTTKTGQRRYVPLRYLIVEEIKLWNLKKDKRIFLWNRHVPSKTFRQFLQSLNLDENHSFHTLRHTYASHLLMSGVNIFIVSRWLGHSSVTVTEKHYGHLIPNTVKVDLPWENIK